MYAAGETVTLLIVLASHCFQSTLKKHGRQCLSASCHLSKMKEQWVLCKFGTQKFGYLLCAGADNL